ncbi:unnamed protein product [Prunus brigantina]
MRRPELTYRKKFLSVMLLWDLPFGGGKPPNYHLGGEVYHPNFYTRQLGCPQLISLKSYRSYNQGTSWRDTDDLDLHKDCTCAINKINNNSSTTTKVLFDGWDSRTVYTGAEAKNFVVHTIEDINA